MDENKRLWQVNLTLTSDNEEDLRVLTVRMRKKSCEDTDGWQRLGTLLFELAQLDKAEQIYEVLLEHVTNDYKKAVLYHQLGYTKHSQGKYEEAMILYKNSLDIALRTFPPDHHNFATSYNNIGFVCQNMGEYSKALSFGELVVDIGQRSLPENHPTLQGCKKP